MGNVEVHDLAPVRDDERKELNLSRKITYRQFFKHIKGEAHEACLVELPWSIRDSISLYERMNASFNVITEIPPEIPLRLPHLNHLDLSHNRIDSLPESFGLLFHLRTLSVKYNQLTRLPCSFVHLVKLEKVDLAHNHLKDLPDDMGNMESLAKLNVSHNKLKSLPLSLGGSRVLELLLVSGNKLDQPPQSICDEGSEDTIIFLRKLFISSGHKLDSRPVTPLNQFPRVRGNQIQSTVSNPHSATVEYIQVQTDTTNTPLRIKTPLMPPADSSEYDPYDLRDKIIGMIYGAAIGDAIGLATRWMSSDLVKFTYDLQNISYQDIAQDEHRVWWRQGDWSANFDLMAIIVDCVISWAGVLDELDFAKRLKKWQNKGFPELGDHEGILLSDVTQQVCQDPGFLTDPHGAADKVFHQRNGCVMNNSQDRMKSHTNQNCNLHQKSNCDAMKFCDCDIFGVDNGAVVRTAILGIPYFHDLHEVEENTVRICKSTHSSPQCIASCVVITVLISLMLQGKYNLKSDEDISKLIKTAAEFGRKYFIEAEQFKELQQYTKIDDIHKLNLKEPGKMSHTFKPLGAAMYGLRSQLNFRACILQVLQEAGDSNSNCCVTGAVLGCKVGYSRLPKDWITGLRKKQTNWLNVKINLMLDMMGIP